MNTQKSTNNILTMSLLVQMLQALLLLVIVGWLFVAEMRFQRFAKATQQAAEKLKADLEDWPKLPGKKK